MGKKYRVLNQHISFPNASGLTDAMGNTRETHAKKGDVLDEAVLKRANVDYLVSGGHIEEDTGAVSVSTAAPSAE